MPSDPRAAIVARLAALPAAEGLTTVRVYQGEVQQAARGALNLSTILPAALVVAARLRIGRDAFALTTLDVRALVMTESRALRTEAAEADAYGLARALALSITADPVWTDGGDSFAVIARPEGHAVDVELLLSTDGLSVYSLGFTVVQSAG